MSIFPDTRNSLLARIECLDDQEAWNEFTSIYRPVVYRLARKQGLQDADAEDLAQRVFVAVSRAVGTWRHDPQRGRFRSWLGVVVRNAILNALSRRPPDRAAGGTTALEQLQREPDAGDPASALLRLEYRRSLFRWAARRVREELPEATWQCFWLSAVERRSIAETAAELQKTVGAVYAARSRVMRRLREVVEQHERDNREGE